MKRIIALIICIIALFSITACGKNEIVKETESSATPVVESSSKPSGPKYDSEPIESFPKAEYPLNRETMSYDEYFSTERLVFRTSVYDGWEVSGNNVFVLNTNKLIFSADKPIERIILCDHVFFYISEGKLYRYHIDSDTTDFICNAQNVQSISPITNFCGALFMNYINEGEKEPAIYYFDVRESTEILEESHITHRMSEIREQALYALSQYQGFPSSTELQSKNVYYVWSILRNYDTREVMSYDEYFSEERFFIKSLIETEIDDNKVIDSETGTVLLEADGPIQHIDVSDYLIYYSCNNNIYRYHRDSGVTDFICNIDGYTHFWANTNMAGIVYEPEKEGEEIPEMDYFDMCTGNEVIEDSDRVKALSEVRIHVTVDPTSGMYGAYYHYDVQSESIYEIFDKFIAGVKLFNFNESIIEMYESSLERTYP